MTYTGREFDLLDPQPESVFIEDIAHALANTCRFSGHTKAFRSVAAHSIDVMRYSPENLRLEALLHDAAEAYIHDITRPLKALMGETYTNIEHRVHNAIALRFGIATDIAPQIKDADNAVLAAEARDLMHSHPCWGALDYEPIPDRIVPSHTPAQDEWRFIGAFNGLTGGKLEDLYYPA